MLQSLPRSAEEYAASQRREIGAAVSAVSRLWRRMGPEFDASWNGIVVPLSAVMSEAQSRVAEGALAYVPAVLEDTGQSRAVPAVARPQSGAFVGVAGDGRPVDSLAYQAVVGAKTAVGGGSSVSEALASSGQWLTQAMGTVLSDTGRAAERVGMAVRPVGGYVRMLTPPSCSRCVILAGRVYYSSAGFQRHPGCDCRHIPASESVAGDLTVDPGEYFESLSPAEQDKAFTAAGAEAIRNGADVNQVVNARRGMRRAQVAGRDVLVTTEGTTRRGFAYRRMTGRVSQGANDIKVGRYRRARAPRLMPETIQQLATDKADYLRLLRTYGYIL